MPMLVAADGCVGSQKHGSVKGLLPSDGAYRRAKTQRHRGHGEEVRTSLPCPLCLCVLKGLDKKVVLLRLRSPSHPSSLYSRLTRSRRRGARLHPQPQARHSFNPQPQARGTFAPFVSCVVEGPRPPGTPVGKRNDGDEQSGHREVPMKRVAKPSFPGGRPVCQA